MLLRRVIQHVKAQNWTAVIIDFVIVVVGVFVGIQVQTFYESQREQQLIQGYLHSLHDDFALSIQGTERTYKFITTSVADLGIVISSLRECSIPVEQKDRFSNGLFHMGKMVPAHFVTGTLDEMRASGRLLLVKNEVLRKAINEAVREYEHQSRISPLIGNRLSTLRSGTDGRSTFWFDGPVRGMSVATWDQLEFDFMKACKDKDFVSRISAIYNTSYVGIEFLERNLRHFRNVQIALEGELND